MPDELAQKATSAGLLTAEAVEAMLRERLRRRAGDALLAMWQHGPQEALTPGDRAGDRRGGAQGARRAAYARGELMPGSAHQPLRLVLDTNVAVAELLWNGPPRRLIELAIEGEAVELFSSPVLLDELVHTLGYSKFASRIAGFRTSIAALVAQYTALVSLVMPASVAACGGQRCR